MQEDPPAALRLLAKEALLGSCVQEQAGRTLQKPKPCLARASTLSHWLLREAEVCKARVGGFST